MSNGRLFLRCTVCALVALCWPSVVLERAEAAGEEEGKETAPGGAEYSSSSAPVVIVASHHQQTEQEKEHRQQPHQEPSQLEQNSSLSTEEIPSLPGDCSSFVQSRAPANEDVSCFPHNDNIGSRTASFRTVHNIRSVVDCLKECRKVSNCSHFTYNKNERVCHLKESSPQFYTYPGDVTGPRSCDTSCFLGCLTYDTTPMKTVNIGNRSPAFCQSACMGTPNCRAFVHENSQCKLFGARFSRYRAVSGRTTLAGPRNDCANPTDLRGEELWDGSTLGSCLKSDNFGSQVPEIERASSAPDVRTCQRRCAQNRRCTHYTYNIKSRNCFLKSGSPTYYVRKDDVTGDKDCVPT